MRSAGQWASFLMLKNIPTCITMWSHRTPCQVHMHMDATESLMLSGLRSTHGCSNAVFCGPCALFSESNHRDKGVLVNRPFSNWVKISNVLSCHSKLVYHREAAVAADILKTSVENPGSRIDVMTNHNLQA